MYYFECHGISGRIERCPYYLECHLVLILLLRQYQTCLTQSCCYGDKGTWVSMTIEYDTYFHNKLLDFS